MASWKDKLRPASFRGIPFFIDSSQFTGGRRVVNHEFPDRDTPYAEDLGKAGASFKVEGHLLGDDYFEQKARMRAAADKYGAGELIHPYFGTMLVQCGAFAIDEDNKEGRICKISFQFYEAGDNRQPKAVNDKTAVLQNNTLTAVTASKSAFDKAFSVAKAPGFVVDSARKAVAKAATIYQNSTKSTRTLAEETANLAYGITNLRTSVDDLLQEPSKLSERLLNSFALLEEALGTPEGKLQAYAPFITFGQVSSEQAATPSRERERQNDAEFSNFMKRVAVASSVSAASEKEYSSTQEALKARDDLTDRIEEILQETNDDDVFAAFEALNASLVQVLPDDDSDLPNIQKVTLPDTMPSLVVAYDLFERADAEEDLILRNKIRNPGFIVGGAELEVLNVRKGA